MTRVRASWFAHYVAAMSKNRTKFFKCLKKKQFQGQTASALHGRNDSEDPTDWNKSVTMRKNIKSWAH